MYFSKIMFNNDEMMVFDVTKSDVRNLYFVMTMLIIEQLLDENCSTKRNKYYVPNIVFENYSK